MVGRKAGLMFLLLSLGLVAATFHPAQTKLRATIDFSGLAEGAIVNSLSHGAGISGDPIEGSVSVFGYNPDFPGNPPDIPPPNTAMIFDSTCAGGCSGGDDDLFWPELGNVLIISEDLDSDDPDDADNQGAYFIFDFSNFGPGKVEVDSLTVGDVETEEGGEVVLFIDSGEVRQEFTPTGDAVYEEVDIGLSGVHRMEVDLNGSGVIDNVRIVIEEENGEEPEPKITIQVAYVKPENPLEPSNDLDVTGKLTLDGKPLPDHDIRLNLPDGKNVSLTTDQAGEYSFLYKGARAFSNSEIIAVARVDELDYRARHKITDSDFTDCDPVVIGAVLTLQGKCELKEDQDVSHDLLLTGALTGIPGGYPLPDIVIDLNLPDGNNLSLTTDEAGEFSYLFEGADQYYNQEVTAETTVAGSNPSAVYEITAADFEACSQEKTYQCNNVFLFTYHGQPIEPGSQIPGWGLVDTHIICKDIGQGRSCRLVIKDQPGYVVKSDTLEMDVPRLEPYVQYQAQIKGYDGAWTSQGCEFSFITGGHVATVSSHLADQVDSLGWVYIGVGRNAIKPLGVCSGWSDACLFADNIIGFHFDDIYGNPLPGSELAGLQPGDRISIYRDYRLYTYEFTGSERVRQSAEGNQAILEAAKEHDLVLTTCAGYRLIDEGHFSHTRLATFTLLPRSERLHQEQ